MVYELMLNAIVPPINVVFDVHNSYQPAIILLECNIFSQIWNNVIRVYRSMVVYTLNNKGWIINQQLMTSCSTNTNDCTFKKKIVKPGNESMNNQMNVRATNLNSIVSI